jgi:hypothetical protein
MGKREKDLKRERKKMTTKNQKYARNKVGPDLEL